MLGSRLLLQMLTVAHSDLDASACLIALAIWVCVGLLVDGLLVAPAGTAQAAITSTVIASARRTGITISTS